MNHRGTEFTERKKFRKDIFPVTAQPYDSKGYLRTTKGNISLKKKTTKHAKDTKMKEIKINF